MKTIARALTVLGLASLVSAVTAAPAPSRPNVVFFLADDLGCNDLSGHGNAYAKTPQLDRFADDAVECSRYYTAPVCNPTRAALMTGRYTFRTFAKSDINMHPDEVTIAEMLRPAGYKTALFGKWHIGDGPHENPLAQGFEEAVTFAKGSLRPENYFDPVLIHNGEEQKYQGYCMDVFTDLAIDFITKHRERCFAAITDNWKLVQPCGMTTTGPIKGALKQYEKLCRDLGYPQQGLSTTKLRFELYNLSTDPGENKDLAAENPAMAAKLRREYNAWLDQITATARWKKSSTAKDQRGEEG